MSICREHFSQKTKQKQANLGDVKKVEIKMYYPIACTFQITSIERQSMLIPEGYLYNLTIHNKTKNIHKST